MMKKEDFVNVGAGIDSSINWLVLWEKLGPFLAQLFQLLLQRKKEGSSVNQSPNAEVQTFASTATTNPEDAIAKLADACMECEQRCK